MLIMIDNQQYCTCRTVASIIDKAAIALGASSRTQNFKLVSIHMLSDPFTYLGDRYVIVMIFCMVQVLGREEKEWVPSVFRLQEHAAYGVSSFYIWIQCMGSLCLDTVMIAFSACYIHGHA